MGKVSKDSMINISNFYRLTFIGYWFDWFRRLFDSLADVSQEVLDNVWVVVLWSVFRMADDVLFNDPDDGGLDSD